MKLLYKISIILSSIFSLQSWKNYFFTGNSISKFISIFIFLNFLFFNYFFGCKSNQYHHYNSYKYVVIKGIILYLRFFSLFNFLHSVYFSNCNKVSFFYHLTELCYVIFGLIKAVIAECYFITFSIFIFEYYPVRNINSFYTFYF